MSYAVDQQPQLELFVVDTETGRSQVHVSVHLGSGMCDRCVPHSNVIPPLVYVARRGAQPNKTLVKSLKNPKPSSQRKPSVRKKQASPH